MNVHTPRTVGLALLAAVLLVAGCASTGTRGVATRDLITLDVIQRSPASNVLQLIQRERPSWLRVRGSITASATDEGIEEVPIVVYLDNGRFGTVSDLASLSTHGITELRRLSAPEATQRFGTGHPRGAILVSTRP